MIYWKKFGKIISIKILKNSSIWKKTIKMYKIQRKKQSNTIFNIVEEKLRWELNDTFDLFIKETFTD